MAANTSLSFTPVAVKLRRDGWTPRHQRDFIAALATSGCVATAARAVGRTPQTAWRLRKRPDAESFAAAWDRALDTARLEMFERTVEAALSVHIAPRFYRGRFVSLNCSESRDDALLVALRSMIAAHPGQR